MSAEECRTEEGRNGRSAYCRLCGCKVIAPGAAVYEEGLEMALPSSGGAALPPREEWEEVRGGWVLTNQMHFENVAFSTPLGDMRLLSCADCEQEVVGAKVAAQRFCLVHGRLLWDDAAAAALKARLPRQELSAAVLQQLGVLGKQ
mmetsp:Transcript_1637/g.5801  ORF Transcript_1637/g.5801 Transcript_1637/m.5801 type:complete len:146 (+) Transcript_1637:30-467(+)